MFKMVSRDAVCPDSWSDSLILQLEKAPHTITELSSSFTVGEIQRVTALSPTLRRSLTLIFDSKISKLESSVQWTFFHFSVVQSLCILSCWRLLILFLFLNSGFLTAIPPYRSASQSLLLSVNADTFFITLAQLCCDVWSSHPSVKKTGDSNEIVLCSCFFWSASPTFGLVLSCFLMSPNSKIRCSSGNFKKILCLNILLFFK